MYFVGDLQRQVMAGGLSAVRVENLSSYGVLHYSVACCLNASIYCILVRSTGASIKMLRADCEKSTLYSVPTNLSTLYTASGTSR